MIMNPVEFEELLRLVKKLGEDTKLSPEEARACLLDISGEDNIRDFYLPRVTENFYYDPKIFRKLLGIR
jgi:hypothetical protein